MIGGMVGGLLFYVLFLMSCCDMLWYVMLRYAMQWCGTLCYGFGTLVYPNLGRHKSMCCLRPLCYVMVMVVMVVMVVVVVMVAVMLRYVIFWYVI